MYEAITVVGNAATVENVVVGYRVSVNANIFRTVSKGLVSTPDTPGSLKQQGIFPLFKQILFVEGVDLILLDKRNGKTLELIHDAKAAGRNWNMSSRSSMRQAISFVAIKSSDESEVGTVLQQAA